MQQQSNLSLLKGEMKLFYNLYNTLYTCFYTKQEKTGNPKKPNTSRNFLENLQKANQSIEQFNEGWLVEEIEYGGNILVKKGGTKRYTHAGDFLRENFRQGTLQKGEKVKLFHQKEYRNQQEGGFYFVFGETLMDNNNSALVRLYFNLKPEGAKEIIQLFTKVFNEWQIPFQFKCLDVAAHYQRADSAVLYFDKRYSNLVFELMKTIYPKIQHQLKHSIPLFTKYFADGIGFAENPPDSKESFGTSRCKIIANGIIEGWKQKKAKQEWIECIIKSIENNFLQIEAMYLNPNTKYPYHFPHLEN